jgi:hypothetical protein
VSQRKVRAPPRLRNRRGTQLSNMLEFEDRDVAFLNRSYRGRECLCDGFGDDGRIRVIIVSTA